MSFSVGRHLGLICQEIRVPMVNGSQGEALWRDEVDIVEEIKVEGEWSGGSVDGEWNQINAEDTEQEEAA